MNRRRGAIEALGIWVAGSVLVFATAVVVVLVQGGHFHRTPTCGGSEVNIYSTGLAAAGCGLIAAMIWWALGAATVRWRWARLGITLVVSAGLIGWLVVLNPFTYVCMGGPLR